MLPHTKPSAEGASLRTAKYWSMYANCHKEKVCQLAVVRRFHVI